MAASHQKCARSLAKDKSIALEHTCKRLVELLKCLLAKSHSYVSGKFTADPTEKAFDTLRQGNGGTYFIKGAEAT